MIFGITGGQICAGRSTFAKYMVEKYNFIMIDVFQEYNKICEKKEESKERLSNQTEGIQNFKEFYSSERREELIEFMNQILNKARADWNSNYVVYPMPLVPEL